MKFPYVSTASKMLRNIRNCSLFRRVGREACNVESGQGGHGLAMLISSSNNLIAAINLASWRSPSNAQAKSAEAVLKSVASMTIEEAQLYMESGPNGLTENEAAARLHSFGANILSTKKPPTWWQILLSVLPNPFNILLTFLAVISLATPPPNWSTFIILVVMIVISCSVRFWQEYRSGIAAVKLQGSVTTQIQARRQVNIDGIVKPSEVVLDIKMLVPGDIVLLNPGDNVPADCLLLQTSHLQITQSSLTGESEPQVKTGTTKTEKAPSALFDIENLAFMGTNVISGTATGLIVRTGDGAFIATIMKQLNKKRPVNSFQKGVRNVSFMMIGFMAVMVSIVLVINGETSHNWRSAALFSVSVAVGLVPEMLPAIVNANLARGAFTLSKKKAIVKRLDAIQNLGGMTVLCSDKTGTLTRDEIALCRNEDCHGATNDRVFQLAYTNAHYQSGKKNSIDTAILKGHGTDEKRAPTVLGEFVAEIPFNFEKRRSGAIIREDATGALALICKGAFEEVLTLCSLIRFNGQLVELKATHNDLVIQRAAELNNDGYRVLAVATKVINASHLNNEDSFEDIESRMVLEGFLAFLDPPKDDAALSIARLRELGVETKVLTGDSLGIALKVCRSMNMTGNVEEGIRTITGSELAELDGPEFHEAVQLCTIFAKLAPSQKGDVIMSLKASGHAVGMLGDGINDCVALRFADVGISVDTGTNVAKDCADVILTEKTLSIMVDCVTIGRLTHGNTIKYIKMVASSNFGNVFSVLIASAWLPFQPMTALQILVQNLLYDISQIAIPWDRMDKEFVQRPQRWRNRDLLRFIVILGPTSSTIDMCTFCLNWFYYGIRSNNDPALVARFHTHWFLEGLLTQTVIVHLLRTAKIPVIQRRAAPVLVVSTLLVMAVGLSLPYIPPIARALGLVRPANSFLGFLVAEIALYCIEVQVVKMVYIKLFGTWL